MLLFIVIKDIKILITDSKMRLLQPSRSPEIQGLFHYPTAPGIFKRKLILGRVGLEP
jgi:hypothetical protein